MNCIGCGDDKKIVARGYCGPCYHRLRKRGTLERAYVQRVDRCVAPGCDRPSFARNLCTRHYEGAKHPLNHLWRLLRSRAPGQYPPAWDRFPAFLADVGERPSEGCQLRRIDGAAPWSKDNFRWLAPINPGADHMTRDARSAYQREWHLNRRFNLTGEEYSALLAEQNGGCAICGGKETHLSRNGKPKDLSVDHDHETGDVRGLLCVNCNRALGYFEDSVVRLQAAISYLQRHRRPRLVRDNVAPLKENLHGA